MRLNYIQILDFLKFLRTNGFIVTLDHEIKINNLLVHQASKHQKLTKADISCKIASICSSNQDEYKKISSLFDTFFNHDSISSLSNKTTNISKRKTKRKLGIANTLFILLFSSMFFFFVNQFDKIEKSSCETIICKSSLGDFLKGSETEYNNKNNQEHNNDSKKTSEADYHEIDSTLILLIFKKYLSQLLMLILIYFVLFYSYRKLNPNISITRRNNRNNYTAIAFSAPNKDSEDIVLSKRKKQASIGNKNIDILKTINKLEQNGHYFIIKYKKQNKRKQRFCVILEKRSANDHKSIFLEKTITSLCNSKDIECDFFYFIKNPLNLFNNKNKPFKYNMITENFDHLLIIPYPSSVISNITGDLNTWVTNISKNTKVLTTYFIGNSFGIKHCTINNIEGFFNGNYD